MLLDVCMGTRTSWKILFVLSEAPGKGVSRKEIQSLTRLGNKVIGKFIVLLERFDIIIMNKIGKTFYYKLNLSNPFVERILEVIKLEKKALNNLDFLVLNILREFVLKEDYDYFLSLKRTYSDNSDIDVAIVFKEKNFEDELLITEITDKLGRRFKKEIQVHYYTLKEFYDNKKSRLLL